LLLVNKSDLGSQIPQGRLEPLREKGWTVIPTSAKTGAGVEEAFSLLAQRMLEGKTALGLWDA